MVSPIEMLAGYLVPAIPGIGAAALAIYNFLKARSGAEVHISPMYNFGFINLARDKIPNKIMFFTFSFENIGTSVASINTLKLEVLWSEKRTVMYPMRRVELTKPEKGTLVYQENFAEVLPVLPVYVPPYSGETFTFEFHDIKNPFPIEEDTRGIITVTYRGGEKEAQYEFPMRITEKLWRASRGNVINEYVTPPDEPEFLI